MLTFYTLKYDNRYLLSVRTRSIAQGTFHYACWTEDPSYIRIYPKLSTAKAQLSKFLKEFEKLNLVPPQIDLVQLSTFETVI